MYRFSVTFEGLDQILSDTQIKRLGEVLSGEMEMNITRVKYFTQQIVFITTSELSRHDTFALGSLINQIKQTY